MSILPCHSSNDPVNISRASASWGEPVPGRVPRWGCLMGVRPREGRLGDEPPPAPWCRGVASAREDTGLARGTED